MKRPKRETIIYRGKKYHRYPESKRRQLRVYFWRHDEWKAPPKSLHRQIWIDKRGKIPKGHVIHHKDENPLNNRITNLQCLSKKEHNLHHYDSSVKNGICKYKFCKKKFTFTNGIRGAEFCSVLCWARHKNKVTPDKFWRTRPKPLNA